MIVFRAASLLGLTCISSLLAAEGAVTKLSILVTGSQGKPVPEVGLVVKSLAKPLPSARNARREWAFRTDEVGYVGIPVGLPEGAAHLDLRTGRIAVHENIRLSGPEQCIQVTLTENKGKLGPCDPTLLASVMNYEDQVARRIQREAIDRLSTTPSSLPITLRRTGTVGLAPTLTITNNSSFSWRISFSGPVTYSISLAPHGSETITLAPGTYYISGQTDSNTVIPFPPASYTFPQDVTGTFTITVP